ncbi:MAG: hypothetical protein GXO15_00205 [Crenarchaeota archaeon]|nr:hypothetical protein [Thermoproteota archaeon]
MARPRCPEVLEEGVYAYQPGDGWVRGSAAGSGAAGRVYVFVNLPCSRSCQWALDRVWEQLGALVESGVVELVLVVCTRFRYVCRDDSARRLFSLYGIVAVPSLVVSCCGKELGVIQGRLRIEDEFSRVADELRHLLARRGGG